MHKMKILYIFCVLLTLLVSVSNSTEVSGYQSLKKPNGHFNIIHNCRKTRDVDQEDVINRFEMERVSPLYDILRHLPAFEDSWLPNPVTSPTFSSPPPLRLNNESSSYGEFKIELSKDEEHVVSESGRGFQENSALNWYYSAESYSSVNNFSGSGINRSQLQPTIPGTTKLDETPRNPKTTNEDVTMSSKTTKLVDTFSPKSTKVEDVFSPKPVISRKLDEEHVVSHVPSLKGGRGSFVDFNLLESSTTPKIESTLSSKNEEPKPNITTRYILLQSGRVVAINVTSVSTLVKPSSSPGSSNKNPSLPTFYFGSRIRNKNATNPLSNNTTSEKQETLSTRKPSKVESNVEMTTKISTDFKKANQLKATIFPTVRLSVEVSNVTSNPTNKRTSSFHPVSIKPSAEYTRTQQLKNGSSIEKSQKIKEIPESNQSHQVKETGGKNNAEQFKPTPIVHKSQKSKENPTTTNFQQTKEAMPTTKTPSLFLRETTPLDLAQKWWSEMRAAKLQRSYVTTVKPKIITISSRNALQSLVAALRPSTDREQQITKSFDSIKKPIGDRLTDPTIVVVANARIGKGRTIEKETIHFSTTTIPPKITGVFNQNKPTKPWTTFQTDAAHGTKRSDTLTSAPEEDILEPSVPLSNVQHDFVRIVTVPPPVTLSGEFKPTVSSVSQTKENKVSSRRPRYRGLSHVNLQAPIKSQIQTSTVPSKYQLSTALGFHLTTAPPRRLTSYQPLHRGNPLHSSTHSSQSDQIATPVPPRRSRNGFYLRNSVSFQTIPPGSLTDRRTLTREEPVEASTTVENLQPPLEDLLIISFEPTRKTLSEIQDTTDGSIRNVEKARNFRIPPRKENPLFELPLLTTAKPQRRVIEKSYNDARLTERTDTGNRVGRHFRTNNSKFQGVLDIVESTSPPSVTTKQTFRVYYFEPKRRKMKSDQDSLTDEKPVSTFKNNEKPPRTNPERVLPTVKGGNSPYRERNRNFHNYEAPIAAHNNQRPTNGRSPKQLQLTARDRSSTTEAVTTPRPVSKKLRSSPFIWHQPNVGIHKKIPQDDASSN